jgi:hypothetical protein
MAVKHEEYDGEDEKTIVAATTDIASCAPPRHSHGHSRRARHSTYKLPGVAWEF